MIALSANLKSSKSLQISPKLLIFDMALRAVLVLQPFQELRLTQIKPDKISYNIYKVPE